MIVVRIFLIVLVLIILTIIYSLNVRTTIVITIQQPTKDQFEVLPSNAHCSCSRISISYAEFISIETKFHQVCSSDFVSDRWFQAINSGYNTTYFIFIDFRTFESASFQALASLCRLVKASTLQSITSFLQISLFSPEVLSESAFQSKIAATMKQFQLTSPYEFSAPLQLIRELILNNQFETGVQTNIIQFYFTFNTGEFHIDIGSQPIDCSYCSTDLSSKLSLYLL